MKNYITGVFRGDGGQKMKTHLYDGTFEKPGLPMCSGGWQRKYFNKKGKLVDWEYSIFRNNVSKPGICKTCQRRAEKDLSGIKTPVAKYNPRNRNHHKI